MQLWRPFVQGHKWPQDQRLVPALFLGPVTHQERISPCLDNSYQPPYPGIGRHCSALVMRPPVPGRDGLFFGAVRRRGCATQFASYPPHGDSRVALRVVQLGPAPAKGAGRETLTLHRFPPQSPQRRRHSLPWPETASSISFHLGCSFCPLSPPISIRITIFTH